MSQLANLIARAGPDWVLALEAGADEILAEVAPPLVSGAPGRQYTLRLALGTNPPKVFEHVPGTCLPRWCAERHINPDFSFCLGLNVPAILDQTGATRFWQSVRTYLVYQQHADRTGRWPERRWLSHGDAAVHQLRAEEAARACGLEQAYADALEYGEGWLAGRLPRIVRARHSASNPQPACPFPELGRRQTIRLRQDCQRCIAIVDLVVAEAARRSTEQAFVDYLRRTNYPCCRTMRSCPLKEG